MKKLLSIYMIICTLLLFSACGSEKTAPEESTKAVEVTEEVVDISFVTGTYIGNQGSAISVYEDGEAVYYWNGWDEIKSGNKWHYEDGVLTITVDALSCDITAEIDEQIAQGDEIIFKSDSINWDNETFKKVYSDCKKLTSNEYKKVIEATWPTETKKVFTSNLKEDSSKSIYVGDYRFLMPTSFAESENTVNGKMVGDNDVVIMMINSSEADKLLSYAIYQDQFAKEIVKNLFSESTISPCSTYDVEFGEATGKLYEFEVVNVKNGSFTVPVIVSVNSEGNDLLAIVIMYSSEKTTRATEKYADVVGSAKKEAEPIPEVTTEPIQEESESAGVDPELKEFLDSYEKFIDRYVEFMQEYKKGTNLVGMLADYSKIMTEYMDFASKLEKIDEKSLSTADYAYYLEVTTRTLKKMSEIL